MTDLTERRYEFPPFRVDVRNHVLQRDDQRIHLTEKAFSTLLVLLENAGHAVGKQELVDRVWPGTAVEENNLNQCISAIRKALGERPGENRFILTVPGKGYRFVAAIRDSTEERVPAPLSAESPPDIRDQGESELGIQPATLAPKRESFESRLKTVKSRPQTHMPKAVVLGGLAALVLIALALGAFRRSPLTWRRPLTSAPASTSLAVLPFLNLGGGPENDYLSDGFSEELTTGMAEVPGLRVVARTSAFQFRGAGVDVRRIGEELDVGAVMEGSVSSAGGTLHITAQLINTRTGYHLWSHAYDGNFRDIYTIQEQIVDDASRALGVSRDIPSAISSAPHRTNPEAHDLYLRGRYYWSRRDLPDMQRAIGLFQAAIQRDPQFALAYAGLADTYTVLGGNGQEPLSVVVPLAKSAITRALDLDPTLGDEYATLVLLNSESSGRRRQLEPDLRRAIALSPGSATAHQWLGAILTGKGRFEEADTELREAQVLDPLSPMIRESLAQNFYGWRRYDDAIEQVRCIEEMNSDVGDWVLGRAYIQKRKYLDAIRVFAAHRGRDSHSLALVHLAAAYAASGNKRKSRKLLRQSAISSAGYVSPYWTAAVYVQLGEKEEAFRWLEKSYEQKDPNLGWIKIDPMLDALRPDSRYAEFVRKADLND